MVVTLIILRRKTYLAASSAFRLSVHNKKKNLQIIYGNILSKVSYCVAQEELEP